MAQKYLEQLFIHFFKWLNNYKKKKKQLLLYSFAYSCRHVCTFFNLRKCFVLVQRKCSEWRGYFLAKAKLLINFSLKKQYSIKSTNNVSFIFDCPRAVWLTSTPSSTWSTWLRRRLTPTWTWPWRRPTSTATNGSRASTSVFRPRPSSRSWSASSRQRYFFYSFMSEALPPNLL